MNISNPNSLQTSTQSSICGLVQNRIPKATSSVCKWQTSDDGSYQWLENCYLIYQAKPEKIVGHMLGCDTIRRCAVYCLANSECNYFHYRNLGNGLYDCVLINFNGLLASEAVFTGLYYGFIVDRKANIDFIPNYCDLK
jgi:hypothetical protein